MATTGNGPLSGAWQDPMRQFAELAGDVRDPYPMLAGLRESNPVSKISLGAQTGHRRDVKAPPLPALYTAFSRECVARVLTDPARFSSGGYAMSIEPVMGKTILQMDPPEHLRHRTVVAKAFRARVLEQWGDTLIAVTIKELIDGLRR